MRITKIKLRQLIKEEIRTLLNEFKEGDTVEHKEENFGVGKVIAISRQGASKGQVTVLWPGSKKGLTHRGDLLEPTTKKGLEEVWEGDQENETY